MLSPTNTQQKATRLNLGGDIEMPRGPRFSVTDVTDGSLIVKANVPISFLATVVGSAIMLGVNGLTWWRM